MAIVLKKNLIADLLKIKEILKTRMKLCERKITTDLPKKKHLTWGLIILSVSNISQFCS